MTDAMHEELKTLEEEFDGCSLMTVLYLVAEELEWPLLDMLRNIRDVVGGAQCDDHLFSSLLLQLVECTQSRSGGDGPAVWDQLVRWFELDEELNSIEPVMDEQGGEA